MSRSLTVAVSFLLFAAVSYTQEPPVKWGEVPMEDLLMKSFPGDSNATAVILCDYGETRIDNNLDLKFKRHLRIKILDEKGYEWGTQSISIYTKDDYESLDDLEAVTYSLDKNGGIEENELDDDNIFEEKVSDTRTKYNFTMPALSPGCIIDIRYSIIATSLFFIRDWPFQWEEPVRWSEYRVVIPGTIAYSFVSIGYEPYAIQEKTEVTQTFVGNAAAYLGGNIVKCNQNRWAVKNIPALRDVPFVTTIDDFKKKIKAQLAGYAYRGMGVKKVLNNWETLIKELLDDESFGDAIDVTGDVEDLTAEITRGLISPEEKLEAIYKWITGSIVWTGEQRVFTEHDVDDVIEYKKGNSADITFLLISMLKSAGIEGDPLILSTRSNGRIQEVYPIISQFNLTIARVKIGSETYYLDATDPLRPLGQLPVKILNVRALVIKPGKREWVYLSSKVADDEKAVVNVNVNPDGSLKSDIEVKFGRYRSLSIRKNIKDKSDLDLAKELLNTESSGFTIDSVKIDSKNNIDSPFEIKAWLSSSDYIQSGGDILYLNPTLYDCIKENPFKSDKRDFPVDYAYPRSETVVTNINIPSSLELKEQYSDKSYSISNNISYKRKVDSTDNGIQVFSLLQIKKSEIESRYYRRLKSFYSRVIQSEAEMLVLGLNDSKNNDVGLKTEGEKRR